MNNGGADRTKLPDRDFEFLGFADGDDTLTAEGCGARPEIQDRCSRAYAIDGSYEGDGTSIADLPEEVLMMGFGDDSMGG